MQRGNLILIAGFSGSGKTTMARAALSHFPSWLYLTNYTTRPPRDDEPAGQSFEYVFVTKPDYERLRAKPEWGHLAYAGHDYGIDVGAAKAQLASGKTIVSCIISDLQAIRLLEKLLGQRGLLIWIDTPLVVANQRLSASTNKARAARQTHALQNTATAELLKQRADYVFTPKSAVAETTADFIELLKPLI